jgi:hypothetical protein
MKAAASNATVRSAILEVSNRQIEQAAVAIVALRLEHPDGDQEYGDKAAKVTRRCFSRLSLPDSELQELTPNEQEVEDGLFEMIHDRATKMEAALVRAGLLSKRN